MPISTRKKTAMFTKGITKGAIERSIMPKGSPVTKNQLKSPDYLPAAPVYSRFPRTAQSVIAMMTKR